MALLCLVERRATSSATLVLPTLPLGHAEFYTSTARHHALQSLRPGLGLHEPRMHSIAPIYFYYKHILISCSRITVYHKLNYVIPSIVPGSIIVNPICTLFRWIALVYILLMVHTTLY